MMPIERLVEESIEEELAGRTGPEGDLQALVHGMGTAWRDLPPETKAFLIGQARLILRQMWQDPRGALTEIVRLTRLLIGQGQPPLLAAKTAVNRVVVRRKTKALGMAKKKRRATFKRPQRPSPKRFEESWM
jgi:hypothetical protein